MIFNLEFLKTIKRLSIIIFFFNRTKFKYKKQLKKCQLYNEIYNKYIIKFSKRKKSLETN